MDRIVGGFVRQNVAVGRLRRRFLEAVATVDRARLEAGCAVSFSP